jgi:hypothetical protein
MKTIKNSLIALILMFSVLNSTGQEKEKIKEKGNYCLYKTLEEYNENQPVCIIYRDSSKEKIRFYSLFPRPYIDVVKAGKKYRFFKDSLFAYRDTDNKVYRFYKNNDRFYEISENNSLVIYSADVPVVSTSGKIVHFETQYFFSKKLSDDILPLTAKNLKRAFPDNLKFHELIDLSIAEGNPVSAFDKVHKAYRVNELLTKSTTTNW